jgi:5-methylcytosine-specific restriction endonuclease McrA
MEPSTNTTAPLTTTPLPSSAPLAGLSDAELLTATRRLVGRSNQLLASLLAHLAEVEARGIHRARACASLYTYCIYELRFSEDEAFRRVSAARLVRRFPALLDAVAAGELHLTGLLMLGPHLTPDNLVEVLALAKHRTKKELARLVRSLDPLPSVPSRIEPLGPAPSRFFSPAPTWSQSAEALNPIRELQPGARPRDWMDSTQSAPSPNDASSGARFDCATSAGEHALAPLGADEHALARWDDGRPAGEHAMARWGADEHTGEHASASLAPLDTDEHALARWDTDERAGEHASASLAPLDTDEHALARWDAGARPVEWTRGRLEPQRYSVQFEASEGYVALVERAKALLSHRRPRLDLGDLQLRAMRALVAELEREKYGVTARQRVAHASASELTDEQLRREEPERKPEPEPQPQAKAKSKSKHEPQPEPQPEPPRQRGRHVPAAIRRAVFERDAGRCTYRSVSGERCRATARLELHHSIALAQGGEHRLDNVSLRCHAHNALAAEQDFGRDFVARARDSSQHELWARHEGPCAIRPREVEGRLLRREPDTARPGRHR